MQRAWQRGHAARPVRPSRTASSPARPAQQRPSATLREYVCFLRPFVAHVRRQWDAVACGAVLLCARVWDSPPGLLAACGGPCAYAHSSEISLNKRIPWEQWLRVAAARPSTDVALSSGPPGAPALPCDNNLARHSRCFVLMLLRRARVHQQLSSNYSTMMLALRGRRDTVSYQAAYWLFI
jgi:hypothetical protein